MKMRRPHLVSLSRQAISILRELQEYSGEGTGLFPSIRTEVRPISDATMLNALRRMGYQKHELSVHVFSIASTLLNGLGHGRDRIERQLAHGEQDEVRAAGNGQRLFPEPFSRRHQAILQEAKPFLRSLWARRMSFPQWSTWMKRRRTCTFSMCGHVGRETQRQQNLYAPESAKTAIRTPRLSAKPGCRH